MLADGQIDGRLVDVSGVPLPTVLAGKADVTAVDLNNPANTAISARTVPPPDNDYLLASNPGSGDANRRERLPLSSLRFSVSRSVWSGTSDTLQLLDPSAALQGDPIYFNASGLTIRATLNAVGYGPRYTIVNSGASTTILDPGPAGAILGLQAQTIKGGEMTLRPGESVTIARLSGSIFYVISLKDVPASFNASTYSWYRRNDGRYDLDYPNLGISGGATITVTLPAPFDVAAIFNGSSHTAIGDASIQMTPFRQTTTPSSVASAFNIYNIVQGANGGGTGASFDIKNFSTGTERFNVRVLGLTLTETARLTAANRIVASLRVMPAGQSLADFMTYGPAGFVFRTGLRAALGTGVLPNGVGIVDAAVGGSAINKSAADVGSDNYWVDNSGGTLVDGPVLTRALTAIAALPAGEQPHIITWDQGQQDAGLARTTPGYAAAGFSTSTAYVWNSLRTAIAAAGGPAQAPIVLTPVGRSFSDTGGVGYRRIGLAQIALASSVSGVTLAPEVYDIELKDSVHGSLGLGQVTYGNRDVSAVLRVGVSGLFAPDATQKRGPTWSASRNGQTITVTVTSENGDTATLPSNPFGFQVETDSGAALAVAWTRSGATYTTTLPGNTGAVVVAYPILPSGEFYIDRMPKGSVSGYPLRRNEVSLS